MKRAIDAFMRAGLTKDHRRREARHLLRGVHDVQEHRVQADTLANCTGDPCPGATERGCRLHLERLLSRALEPRHNQVRGNALVHAVQRRPQFAIVHQRCGLPDHRVEMREPQHLVHVRRKQHQVQRQRGPVVLDAGFREPRAGCREHKRRGLCLHRCLVRTDLPVVRGVDVRDRRNMAAAVDAERGCHRPRLDLVEIVAVDFLVRSLGRALGAFHQVPDRLRGVEVTCPASAPLGQFGVIA